MSENNLSTANAYYQALAEKNIAEAEKHLHPDVQCIGPIVKVVGKESVVEANKKFVSLFKALKIRASFASQNQAMLVYDLECAAPLSVFSSAVLLTFRDSLIDRIELFYDARPFEKK
jgi:hypothetical protein